MDKIKYIETIRRMYIKDELNSKKGKKILATKARVFKISEEDAQAIEEDVVNKFNELEVFISELLEENDDMELYEEDYEEIYEFAVELGLGEEDADYVIDGFLDEDDNQDKEESSNYTSDEIAVEVLEVDNKDEIENNKVEEDTTNNKIKYLEQKIGKINIEFYKNYEDYKYVVYVNEFIEKAYIDFSEKMCSIKNRTEFTYDRVNKLYQDTIISRINDLHVYMLNERIISDDVSIQTLIRFLTRDDLIEEFIEGMKSINSNINSNLQAIRSSSSGSNSIMVGNVVTMAAVSAVTGVFNSAKNGIKNTSYKSEVDKLVYPMIIEQVEYMINEMLKFTLERIPHLQGYGTLKLDVDIESFNKDKKTVEIMFNNLNKLTKKLDKDEEINKLINAIKIYPFKAEIFIRLINLVENDSDKEEIICIGNRLLSGLSEESLLNNKLIKYIKKLYTINVTEIKEKYDIKEIKEKLQGIREKYSINDNLATTIELRYLNVILTCDNGRNLSDETKQELYRILIINNLNIGVEELKAKLNSFMNKYSITTYYFGYDLDYYGTVVAADIKNDKFDERCNYLERGYKTIKNRKIDKNLKAVILKDLREKVNISWKIALEKELSIIGEVISATKDENRMFKLYKDSIKLYKSLGDNPFGKGFNCRDYKYFDTGRILNNHVEKLNQLNDLELFCVKKPNAIINPKEGMVINCKSIVTSDYSENKLIQIKDITEIVYELKIYKSDEGEISNYRQLSIKTSSEKVKLNTYYVNDLDKFATFLYDFIILTGNRVSFIDSVNKVKEDKQKIIDVEGELNNKFNENKKVELAGNKYYETLKNTSGDNNQLIRAAYEYLQDNGKKIVYFEDSNNGSKKINNAINSYANISNNEKIVLCFDNTMFGSAKDGFILTDRGIYNKQPFAEKWFVEYADIRNIEILKDTITINSQLNMSITMATNRDDIKEFLEYCIFIMNPNFNQSGEAKSNIGTQQNSYEGLNVEHPELLDRVLNALFELVNTIESPALRKTISIFKDSEYQKKLENVIQSYADMSSDEIPMLIFDNTAFKSAKEGCLITNKYVYYKNKFVKPNKISVEDIRNVKVKADNLIINGNEIFCTMVERRDRQKFEELISFLLVALMMLYRDREQLKEMLGDLEELYS